MQRFFIFMKKSRKSLDFYFTVFNCVKIINNPTAGSPTITLFQLHSDYYTRLDSQILLYLNYN